jgi:hypothetical protein
VQVDEKMTLLYLHCIILQPEHCCNGSMKFQLPETSTYGYIEGVMLHFNFAQVTQGAYAQQSLHKQSHKYGYHSMYKA